MARETKIGKDTEERRADVEADPAHDDSSTDWSSEGGATEEGPATDPDDGTPS